jgi:hypothetical protein
VLALAEQEESVFEDELAQVRQIVFGRVVAVGHVGLIAEIDKAFVLEVGATIGSGGEGVVVKGIDFEDFLQHGEAADAGVENADGKVREVALEGVFLERERGVASGMGLDMGDDFFQDGFSLSKQSGGEEEERAHGRSRDLILVGAFLSPVERIGPGMARLHGGE